MFYLGLALPPDCAVALTVRGLGVEECRLSALPVGPGRWQFEGALEIPLGPVDPFVFPSRADLTALEAEPLAGPLAGSGPASSSG